MQERILCGWDETKCVKHRQNAKEGNFKTKCEEKGICVYTHAEHVALTYDEHELLYEVLDYVNTNEMLSKDKEHRQTIIYLANKLSEMQQQKRKLINGTKGRITGQS